VDRTAFVALHEQRLVGSLTSDTGLSAADARALAADLLARAYDRGVTFESAAETYAWLRVCARRLALDLLRVRRGGAALADPWADAAEAADLALMGTRLGAAQRVLAALPDAQREVLRLRYVDGLRPPAIAERLSLPVSTVEALLVAGRGAATRALHRGGLLGAARCVGRSRRTQVQAAAGPAALVALAAVSAVFSIATLPGSVHGPSARGTRSVPPAVALPGAGVPVTVVADLGDPRDLPARVAVADTLPGQDRPVLVDQDPYVDGPSRCVRACIKTPGKPPTLGPEKLHVKLPGPLADDHDDVELDSQYGDVDICTTVPAAMPGDVASCVPSSS
jgi:RNA polymerase sigma-70 factor (ECF subfamily)